MRYMRVLVPFPAIYACPRSLLSLAIGVAIPILVAAYIWRSSAQGEIDPVEVIEQVEQYALDRPAVPLSHSLPAHDMPDTPRDVCRPDTGAA